jgi:Zn-dependent protease with chaperone function
MDRALAQAQADAIVDELIGNTTLTRRDAIHVDVQSSDTIDAYSKVWRAPGWDVDFCEMRDGENWDRDPQAVIAITTGLIAAVSSRQLRALIAHELAHIEAGDHLSQEWVSNEKSRVRERRADLRAVEICRDGPALAVGLLHLFRSVAPESADHGKSHGTAGQRADAIAGSMEADLGL